MKTDSKFSLLIDLVKQVKIERIEQLAKLEQSRKQINKEFEAVEQKKRISAIIYETYLTEL